MDGRKNNGAKKGENRGQGRKSKLDEQKTSELAIKALVNKWGGEDKAFLRLSEFAEEGSFNHMKLLFEYAYGKPKESIDHTTNGEAINIPPIEWAK
jgi:hypothetical protein